MFDSKRESLSLIYYISYSSCRSVFVILLERKDALGGCHWVVADLSGICPAEILKFIRAPKYLARGHVFRGLYYLWLDNFLSDYSCCSVYRFGCSPRNGVSVCALLFPPTLCIRSVIDKRRTIVYNVMFHVLSCVRTPPPPGKFNLTLHSKTENMHRQTKFLYAIMILKKMFIIVLLWENTLF